MRSMRRSPAAGRVRHRADLLRLDARGRDRRYRIRPAACLGCAIGLHYAITQPVNRLLSHFRRLSEGDLTSEVRWSSRDEMAELVKGVTGMQRSLADTVRQVSQGSEAISTATHQIAAGNTDLSQRTEEQASALQETAASMEQLTATVKQNADNAMQAQACADTASEIATRGATVVGEVIGTMNEIDQSRRRSPTSSARSRASRSRPTSSR